MHASGRPTYRQSGGGDLQLWFEASDSQPGKGEWTIGSQGRKYLRASQSGNLPEDSGDWLIADSVDADSWQQASDMRIISGVSIAALCLSGLSLMLNRCDPTVPEAAGVRAAVRDAFERAFAFGSVGVPRSIADVWLSSRPSDGSAVGDFPGHFEVMDADASTAVRPRIVCAVPPSFSERVSPEKDR